MLDVPLVDEAWQRISHLFVDPPNLRGRPRVKPRYVLDGILWVVVNDQKWHRLPIAFPSAQTCYHRWLQRRRDGTMQAIFDELEVSFPEKMTVKKGSIAASQRDIASTRQSDLD